MLLEEMLEASRFNRDFKADEYVSRKAQLINNFFRDENLDCAVMGISGGIDSAVAYSLLLRAAMYPNSPIKKVIGLIMPINTLGATNQIQAKNRAKEFLEGIIRDYIRNPVEPGFGENPFDYITVDLTEVALKYVSATKLKSIPFDEGQLVSVVRTPCLYHHAAILQTHGYKSIVVGTTNKSEGGYIGFYGKASDGMVDLQPISDLYKSEVYKVAEFLKCIPESIMNIQPMGDVYDGRVDEEMIGCPYWFLELFMSMREKCNYDTVLANQYILDYVSSNEYETAYKYLQNIAEIRSKNAHKYKVGNPARNLDISIERNEYPF